MHCFVCCEDTEPLYRVCRCDVRIHASCFRSLVTEVASHREACPVCTKPYHTRVVKCPPRARSACILLFLWMGIFVIMVWGRSRSVDFFVVVSVAGMLTLKQNVTEDCAHSRRQVLPAVVQDRELREEQERCRALQAA